MIENFLDDDRGCIGWLRDHPSGFVVNCHRKPSDAFLVLHRARCRTIHGAPPRTSDYQKVCGDNIDELDDWAAAATGTSPTRCGTCQP